MTTYSMGNAMSVRASQAYSNGLKPYSRWNKQDIIEAIAEQTDSRPYEDLTLNQLRGLLTYQEWHHTGTLADETSFYGVDVELATIEELRQRPTTKEKPKEEAQRYFAIVQEWGGTLRHPKLLGTKRVEGTRKGDWLITTNGRYKLSANKTLTYGVIE